MVSIKLICALILITALHITHAAAVMAADTTTTTPSPSSPKFGKLHVMQIKSASLFSQSASYQVDVDPTFMSEGRGRDVVGRPISMAAFLAAEKTNRPPSPPAAAMMKKEDVPVREDRYFGSAWLGSSFLRQMQQHAGVDLSSSSSEKDVVDTSDDTILHKMKMTHIVKSSPWHTDVMVEERSTTPKQVGFYLLNDNPRAYFETKDDDLCIPIIKGSFITFNGRRPHHTVIMDGHVDMLGPFDVFSAKGVDGTEDTIVGSVVPLDDEGHDSESSVVLNEGGHDSEDGARPVLEEEEEKLSLVATTTLAALHTEGRAYFGRTYQAASARNHGYVFAYDAVGLSPCESCKVKLGLATSDEAFKCTKEAYDKAIMLRLSDQLTYTADESGSTGMQRLTFDSPNPIVATNLALFFCNQEGEPVACSFMKPATLMEEVEVNNALFAEYGEQSNEGEVNIWDDSNAGSSLLWSILATGLVASGIIYAL